MFVDLDYLKLYVIWYYNYYIKLLRICYYDVYKIMYMCKFVKMFLLYKMKLSIIIKNNYVYELFSSYV